MENYNVVDYVIIAIISISVIISVVRGLITEVFSLFVWVGAFIGAIFFFEDVAKFLPNLFDSKIVTDLASGTNPNNLNEVIITSVVSFFITFLLLLFLLGLVNLLVSFLIRHLKISIYDRLLGIIFGVLRGGFIVAAITLFLTNSPLTTNQYWQNSQLADSATKWSQWLANVIPDDFLEKINSQKLIDSMQQGRQIIEENNFLNQNIPPQEEINPQPIVAPSETEKDSHQEPIFVIEHQ